MVEPGAACLLVWLNMNGRGVTFDITNTPKKNNNVESSHYRQKRVEFVPYTFKIQMFIMRPGVKPQFGKAV